MHDASYMGMFSSHVPRLSHSHAITICVIIFIHLKAERSGQLCCNDNVIWTWFGQLWSWFERMIGMWANQMYYIELECNILYDYNS